MNPANSKVDDELTWYPTVYALDNLLNDFRLPMIVQIARGTTGPNCFDNIVRGQILFVDSVVKQSRIYAHTILGDKRLYSLSEDFPLELKIIADKKPNLRKGRKSRKTIQRILEKRDKFKLPLRVRVKQTTPSEEPTANGKHKQSTARHTLHFRASFRKKEKRLNKAVGGCRAETHTVPDELVLEEIRDYEQFFRATVMDNGMPVGRTLLPCYLRRVRLRVAMGLKFRSDQQWTNWLDLCTLACRGLDADMPTPCYSVLLEHSEVDDPFTSDDEVIDERHALHDGSDAYNLSVINIAQVKQHYDELTQPTPSLADYAGLKTVTATDRQPADGMDHDIGAPSTDEMTTKTKRNDGCCHRCCCCKTTPRRQEYHPVATATGIGDRANNSSENDQQCSRRH